MTAPQFNSTGAPGRLWGFERDKMLACQTRALRLPGHGRRSTRRCRGILPADADGPTPPPDGAPQPIVTDNDDGAGFPADQIDVWNATMTWGATPDDQRRRTRAYIPVAPFDQDVGCGGGAHVHSAAGDDRSRSTRFRTGPCTALAYRNFGTYQALAFDHTVDADAPSGNRAGIRWYELRKTTRQLGRSRTRARSARPTGSTAGWARPRWTRTANLADRLLDRKRHGTELPEHRLRRPARDDAAEHARPGRGDAARRHGLADRHRSRWGDYSMMTTDPVDDCTFWYTTEYLQTTGVNPWKTRIGSYVW